MNEIIKQKCDEYNITPDVLTPEELADLKKEIEAEQRGEIICDSVLDDPEIHLRALERDE